jgi:hypothetical protein
LHQRRPRRHVVNSPWRANVYAPNLRSSNWTEMRWKGDGRWVKGEATAVGANRTWGELAEVWQNGKIKTREAIQLGRILKNLWLVNDFVRMCTDANVTIEEKKKWEMAESANVHRSNRSTEKFRSREE